MQTAELEAQDNEIKALNKTGDEMQSEVNSLKT